MTQRTEEVEERTTFYLNVIVLNKDEVVEAKVNEKVGTGPLGLGLARKAAAGIAKRAVQEEKVGVQVSQGLRDKLPDALQDLGIKMRITQRYVGGPLIVLHCEVNEVDGLALVTKAKGVEAARHFEAMTEAFTALGVDAGTQQVRKVLFTKSREALMAKLSAVLPEKLWGVAGVKTDVICNDEADEAEWFFSFLEELQGPRDGWQPVAIS